MKESKIVKTASLVAWAAIASAAFAGPVPIPGLQARLDDEDVKALRGFKVLKDAFFSNEVKDEPFNVVVTKSEFGVKHIHVTNDKKIGGRRYRVDPALLSMVKSATTSSGETDTAKWMTGVEKERK